MRSSPARCRLASVEQSPVLRRSSAWRGAGLSDGLAYLHRHRLQEDGRGRPRATVKTSGLRSRPGAALASSVTLAAFRIRGYPALWLSGSASGFTRSVTQVAIGWVTPSAADSVL